MVGSTTDFLTFIPMESRSETAQEAIRVHVLRRRHQQRRENRRNCGKGRPVVAQYGGQFQIWQPETASQQSGSPTPASICQEPLDPYGDLDLSDSIQDEGIECISPSNISSSAEVETATEKESALDRRWIEEMLIQEYLLSSGSPVAHDFLRSYRQTTATFSAFLAMVATRISGDQRRNLLFDPAELENEALQEVLRQISRSPTAPAYSTILTVALLASLRDGQHLVCHWKGLLEMVRLHGGLSGLRTHGDLHAFLFWAEAVAMERCPESLGHLAPTRVEDTQGSIQDLRELLEKVNARLSDHVDHGGVPPSNLTSPVLMSLQQPPPKKTRYVHDKWCRAKLACLVYFAALSLGRECRLQDNPQYRAVETEVLSRERSYPVRPDELYYITVLVGNHNHICELTWSVARLVNAVKELDQRDRNTCYRLLALYLGFQDPFITAMVSTEWEELSDRLPSMPGELRDHNKETSDPGESPSYPLSSGCSTLPMI